MRTFSRPKEIEMSKNRVLYVWIAVALIGVAAVTLRQAVVTKAASASQAAQSYDAIESVRAARLGPEAVQAERTYDAIEGIRQNRNAPAILQSGGQCPDEQCSYQLANGHWVR